MGLFDGTPLERPVTCERCHKQRELCTCPRDASGLLRLPSQQRVRVQRERSRGGWLTRATGFDPTATDLPAMLRKFKERFATGGTTVEDGIELRGDCRDRLVADLRALGYDAKASGG